MSFCQFFEPAVGGSFQPFRRGRRAGQLPLFSAPSAKGGVPGNCPSFPALLPRAVCRATAPLFRPFCQGRRAGRPEPSRCARPHRSLPFTVPPLTMPRVARAPAIPPPPPAASSAPSSLCRRVPGRHRRPPPALHTKSTASQAPPSPGWHVASYRPGTPCHPSPLPPPEPASLATSPLPSTKKPYLVDEMPFCLRHPQKRLFWWMNRHY